jgi:hypothetical protein
LRRQIHFFLVIAILLFCAALDARAQSGKVETLAALADSSVPDALRGTLESKGYRVVLDDGSAVCELWFSKSISKQPKKDVPGAAYPELAESTLVGVLHFAQPGSDYRGQPIAAGYYTLRYELLPNDGNHLGAAASRDFLLLSPAASDSDPSAQPKPMDVIERSRKASGTRHPAPLSLVQPDNAAVPSVTKGEEDHWIFATYINLASGDDLPVALVVKGQAQQ